MNLRRELARLHESRDAALAPIFGFVLLFFAWGIGAVINTGEVAYDKVRTQNAADILALAHADQMARDLNVMALNNIALTQMFVVGTVSLTMQLELIDIGVRVAMAEFQIARSAAQKCKGPPPYVAFCLFIHSIPMIQVLKVGADALAIQTRYRPDAGLATAGRLIGAFNRMNDYIVESFPRRAGQLLRMLADANRVDAFFVYPACLPGGSSECRGRGDEGGDLPLERGGLASGAAHMEMCVAAERGSDGRNRHDFMLRGFPIGKGPYTAGGAANRPHLRDHVNHTAGFASLLPFFDSVMRNSDWLIRYSTPPKYASRQSANDNHFTDLMDGVWSMACGPASGLISMAGLSLPLPRTYWIKDRSPASVMAPDVGFLAMDYEKLARLVVVARQRGGRFNPENFEEREDAYNAYAQALSFNPQALDLYTSRWTARLVPASLMDRAQEVAKALPGRAYPAGRNWFGVMKDTIQAGPDNREWSRVNLH